MLFRSLVLSTALCCTSACAQGGRTVAIEEIPEPVRKAILSEAAGDPIIRIVQGTYAGKQCFTVAVERPDRRSWYSVDELGHPCQ